MNKEEFIKKLRKRLDVLEDKEIEDIVSEYEGYIDEKVSSGLTEEEAIKELGDFDEIVNDLLAAYKVKSGPYEERTFNRVINKISTSIDNFMDSLRKKSGRDIIKTLIEIIIILFLICLLRIPFSIIRDLGVNIFEELIHPIGSIFSSIWSFIIEISYVVVAVIFFIKMFEKRYFKDISENIVNSHDEEVKEKKQNSKGEKINSKTKVIKKEKIKEEQHHRSIVDILTDFCILILKFMALVFLMGIVFYLIGMAFALGFMIYLLISGVKYIGIFLLVIALFLGGTLLLELCVNFVFNRKIKAFSFFSRLITIIILTGVGLTMSAVEIANTELIYGIENTPTKSIIKEIPMTEDLEIYNYENVVIDNTITDKVVIEYKYPNFNNSEIDIKLEPCGAGYCLETDITYVRWSKDFINEFIKGLKDKKIYVSDYRFEKVIHISEENYKKIEKNNNYHKYYHNGYHYNENNSQIFTKIYMINNISKDTSGNYVYLTLYSYQDEDEMETVKIPVGLADNIEIGKMYKFTFESNQYDLYDEEDIEDIFANSKILNIEINEPIYE